MDNSAIVVKINSVEKHPNADRLQLARLFGTQVVVGLDIKPGDILVYVDSNLCMMPDFLHNNSQFRHVEQNKDPKKAGFFDDNGRVKCIKLRGEISDGFLFPLEFLDYTGKVNLKVGDEFQSINGVPICKKYIPKNSKQQGAGNKQKTSAKKKDVPMFKEHFDTSQFMRNKHVIPAGSVCYIEEKIHGTSHRTGFVKYPCFDELPFWKRWLYRLVGNTKYTKWLYLNGTRRVIHTPKIVKGFQPIDPINAWKNSKMEYKKQSFREFYAEKYNALITDTAYRVVFPEDPSINTNIYSNFAYFDEFETGFKDWWIEQYGNRQMDNIGYHDNTMREEVLAGVSGSLLKGEEIYLELFGYEKTGKCIQKNFPYDTVPGDTKPYRVLLYRITLNNEDGFVVDYNREAVYNKADELGLEKPHLYEKFYYDGSEESMNSLEQAVISYAQGQSDLGVKDGETSDTLKEGVVVWFVNNLGKWQALKYKSDAFREGESSLKDEGVIDQEDIN